MNKSGKILFFNATEGNGIIITSQKEKIKFNVADWDDFEVMPSLGLEVVFRFEDENALSISCRPDDYDESIEKVDTISPEDANLQDEVPDDNVEDEPVSEESEEETQEQESDSKEHTEITQHEEIPFEEEDEIDELKEDDEEKREESVTLSLNINHAVANYFEKIERHIKERVNYKKVEGRLDYLITRRFLWTMFNNLSEVDIHLISPKIRLLSNDLKLTAAIYDDLVRKTKYPALAYEEVFLSCQAEYMKIKTGAEDMIEKLSRLKANEKHVGSILKVKKEEISDKINTEEFDILTDELKSLNGAYVDIVHMMAEIDQRYKSDLEQLKNFEKEYRDDFYELFSKATAKHKDNLVDILSAQAYLLDAKLWQEVKTSKAVKSYFKKSSITGELNTKTYLKYYLDSLDETKAKDEDRKLFELYDYLVSIHLDYVMIVASSAEDALDYDSELKNLPKGYKSKPFVDETKALKWAIKNSVKVLIIEDTLEKMDVVSFFKYYKKYVLITPKVILLGSKPKDSAITISKLLSKSITPKVLANNVKELLEEK